MKTGSIPIATFLLISAAAAVFFLDWHTPLGISVSMLYLPICLAGLWLRGWRFAFIMGVLCSGGTIASLFLSPSGVPLSWSVVNRTIGFVAL